MASPLLLQQLHTIALQGGYDSETASRMVHNLESKLSGLNGRTLYYFSKSSRQDLSSDKQLSSIVLKEARLDSIPQMQKMMTRIINREVATFDESERTINFASDVKEKLREVAHLEVKVTRTKESTPTEQVFEQVSVGTSLNDEALKDIVEEMRAAVDFLEQVTESSEGKAGEEKPVKERERTSHRAKRHAEQKSDTRERTKSNRKENRRLHDKQQISQKIHNEEERQLDERGKKLVSERLTRERKIERQHQGRV